MLHQSITVSLSRNGRIDGEGDEGAFTHLDPETMFQEGVVQIDET